MARKPRVSRRRSSSASGWRHSRSPVIPASSEFSRMANSLPGVEETGSRAASAPATPTSMPWLKHWNGNIRPAATPDDLCGLSTALKRQRHGAKTRALNQPLITTHYPLISALPHDTEPARPSFPPRVLRSSPPCRSRLCISARDTAPATSPDVRRHRPSARRQTCRSSPARL